MKHRFLTAKNTKYAKDFTEGNGGNEEGLDFEFEMRGFKKMA
jgi:hypothetical protein